MDFPRPQSYILALIAFWLGYLLISLIPEQIRPEMALCSLDSVQSPCCAEFLCRSCPQTAQQLSRNLSSALHSGCAVAGPICCLPPSLLLAACTFHLSNMSMNRRSPIPRLVSHLQLPEDVHLPTFRFLVVHVLHSLPRF